MGSILYLAFAKVVRINVYLAKKWFGYLWFMPINLPWTHFAVLSPPALRYSATLLLLALLHKDWIIPKWGRLIQENVRGNGESEPEAGRVEKGKCRMENGDVWWKKGFGLSGGDVKKTSKEAGEAESCLSAASSFRAAESMVFSPRRVSLDFFDSFLSRKKNILKWI